MNSEELSARLQPCRESLAAIASHLSGNPAVRSAEFDISARNYPLSGEVIEIYLDAELCDGNALSWYADITPEGDCWLLESRIARHSADGQDTMERFPDVCAAPADIPARLERAVENARKIETYATALAPLPQLATA